MRRIHFVALSSAVLGLLAACGGGGGGGGDADLILPPAFQVSANTGDDTTGDGTAAKPFKTIKRGLAATTPLRAIVHVHPGTYNEANGETFPIRTPQGVQLIGDPLDEPGNVNVIGSGTWPQDTNRTVTIAPGTGSTLEGLVVQNILTASGSGQQPAGILLGSPGITVRRCSVRYTHHGIIWVNDATNIQVRSCYVADCTIGLHVVAAGHDCLVENCQTTRNEFGVMCSDEGVDFGGGPTGSLGLNMFWANTNRDFVNSAGPVPLYVKSCFWPVSPPILGIGNPPDKANCHAWIVNSAGNLLLDPTYVVPP